MIALVMFAVFPTPLGVDTAVLMSGGEPAYGADSRGVTKSKPIYLVVTVNWLGEHLRGHNIATLANFQREFPAIPLTHLVSPAYFLRGDEADAVSKFNSVRKPIDQVGIYVQPWRSLVSEAGVVFRKSPTFWGSPSQCNRDCGSEVPLALYPEKDIFRLVASGLGVLQKAGLGKISSAAAGGWSVTPGFYEALASLRIPVSFSGVSPGLIRERTMHFPVYTWVKDTWSTMNEMSQPYKVPTRFRSVLEVGHAFGLVDYQSTESLKANIDKYFEEVSTQPEKPLVIHLSGFQETSYKFINRLREALHHLFKKSQISRIPVHPIALPMVDAPAR